MFFFFSSRRRHTRFKCDWSSDVCSSDLRNQNTDNGPVTLTVSLTKLHTIDEVPYPAAVSAGVKLVMVSWAIYTALDPSLPAGLSPTVIGSELRGRNAFTGVTITDALEAGALNPFGSPGQKPLPPARPPLR